MKEIAKLKANEEKKRLESEVKALKNVLETFFLSCSCFLAQDNKVN